MLNAYLRLQTFQQDYSDLLAQNWIQFYIFGLRTSSDVT